MTDPARLGPQARGLGQPAVPCAAPACRRAPTAGRLCSADAAQLGQWLAEIRDDWGRVHPARPLAGWTPGSVGGGTLASHSSIGDLDVMALRDPRSTLWAADTGTVADGDALDARATRLVSVPAILAGWADQVREERGIDWPMVGYWGRRVGAPAGPACAGDCPHGSCAAIQWRYELPAPRSVDADRDLLADHLRWIIRQDWAGDFWVEIRAVWGALRAAHGDHTSRPVRRCPELVDDPPVRCGGPVYVQKGAGWCGACGKAWSGFQLARLTRGEKPRPTEGTAA